MANQRRAGATIGLIVAGAILGAICGLLALTPMPLLHRVRPHSDTTYLATHIMTVAVLGGAGLGAVFWPLLAWSFVGPVPLWRMILEPVLGTVAGAFVGLAAAHNPSFSGEKAVLIGGIVGMLVTGLFLSLRSRRHRVHSG